MNIPIQTYTDDPLHRMPQAFLAADVYTAAISAFIVVCVDAAIVDRNKRIIYLATRKAKPMPGPWIIGGRVYAGESWSAAIQRKFAQETGLTISQDHFQFLRMNRYLWKERQQEPQDVGADTLAVTFTVHLTDAEIRSASSRLDQHEYDASAGLTAYDRERLMAEHVHPAIVDIYDQMFSWGPVRWD